MSRIKNITIDEYKRVLVAFGLKYIRENNGHEVWSRKDFKRPVIFQTHIDPVPIHVIASNNRTMGITNKQIIECLERN